MFLVEQKAEITAISSRVQDECLLQGLECYAYAYGRLWLGTLCFGLKALDVGGKVCPVLSCATYLNMIISGAEWDSRGGLNGAVAINNCKCRR